MTAPQIRSIEVHLTRQDVDPGQTSADVERALMRHFGFEYGGIIALVGLDPRGRGHDILTSQAAIQIDGLGLSSEQISAEQDRVAADIGAALRLPGPIRVDPACRPKVYPKSQPRSTRREPTRQSAGATSEPARPKLPRCLGCGVPIDRGLERCGACTVLAAARGEQP